jgi:hypothetical protein
MSRVRRPHLVYVSPPDADPLQFEACLGRINRELAALQGIVNQQMQIPAISRNNSKSSGEAATIIANGNSSKFRTNPKPKTRVSQPPRLSGVTLALCFGSICFKKLGDFSRTQ